MSNEKPQVVVALYRPKAGKLAELEPLVKKHYPTLKEYGLATGHESFIGRSSDGTIVEIFEWASESAARNAHDHPAVAKVWEAMAQVCDFSSLDQLAEAEKPFPHFARAF